MVNSESGAACRRPAVRCGRSLRSRTRRMPSSMPRSSRTWQRQRSKGSMKDCSFGSTPRTSRTPPRRWSATLEPVSGPLAGANYGGFAMIRQRNIDPRSDIGTATFNAALSALQADAAVGGVYVTDCESVDIIECGISGVVSGTSPTIDMSVRVGNDALNITTFNGGTTAFFPPGTTFRLTPTGSKGFRDRKRVGEGKG